MSDNEQALRTANRICRVLVKDGGVVAVDHMVWLTYDAEVAKTWCEQTNKRTPGHTVGITTVGQVAKEMLKREANKLVLIESADKEGLHGKELVFNYNRLAELAAADKTQDLLDTD